MIPNRLYPLALASAGIFLPAAAYAHPGHVDPSHPLISGLVHPFTGLDHLAAMLMVGLWGGIMAGRAAWAVPAAFATALIVGFCFALISPETGSPELWIALSVLVLGAALALKVRAPLPLACLLTGIWGFAHGMAHGMEAPGDGEAVFAAGFVAATVALHLSGVLLARRLPARVVQALGAIGATGGILLFAAT